MIGFELRFSSVGSVRSTTCATTTYNKSTLLSIDPKLEEF